MTLRWLRTIACARCTFHLCTQERTAHEQGITSPRSHLLHAAAVTSWLCSVCESPRHEQQGLPHVSSHLRLLHVAAAVTCDVCNMWKSPCHEQQRSPRVSPHLRLLRVAAAVTVGEGEAAPVGARLALLLPWWMGSSTKDPLRTLCKQQ